MAVHPFFDKQYFLHCIIYSRSRIIWYRVVTRYQLLENVFYILILQFNNFKGLLVNQETLDSVSKAFNAAVVLFHLTLHWNMEAKLC